MRKLEDVLQDELAIIMKLKEVCQKEQDALRADNIKILQEATVVKGELARELAGLEQEREKVIQFSLDTAERQGIILQGKNERIKDLKRRLRLAFWELKEINETNCLLIRQSLIYVQKVISLLSTENTSPGIVDEKV